MSSKPKKPSPPDEPRDESVLFLLETAELTIRDAIGKASQKAHAVQMEALSDILLTIAQAEYYFRQPDDYFSKLEKDD